jgi:hypothetical protein
MFIDVRRIVDLVLPPKANPSFAPKVKSIVGTVGLGSSWLRLCFTNRPLGFVLRITLSRRRKRTRSLRRARNSKYIRNDGFRGQSGCVGRRRPQAVALPQHELPIAVRVEVCGRDDRTNCGLGCSNQLLELAGFEFALDLAHQFFAGPVYFFAG